MGSLHEGSIRRPIAPWMTTLNTELHLTPKSWRESGRKEMFYLMTHSTHFILRLYGVRHMVKDHSVREETCCRHLGYSFRLIARVLLYAPSHRQDSTYHGLCYTSRGVLAGTRNSSMGPPHEGLIRRPIAPWVNALSTRLHLAPSGRKEIYLMIHSTHFFFTVLFFSFFFLIFNNGT